MNRSLMYRDNRCYIRRQRGCRKVRIYRTDIHKDRWMGDQGKVNRLLSHEICRYQERRITMIKTIYQDKYNPQKTWEVTSMSHGFYLKQFICNKQFGRGLRTTREYIQSIGILDMKILTRWEEPEK